MAENNSKKICNLLQLNDDCICEIYKYLPITDWCALSETCTRLRTISDFCFEKQRKKFELSGSYICGSIYNKLEMTNVSSLFGKFGKFLTKLTINSKLFARNADFKEMIPLIGEHCTQLEDVKLVGIMFATRVVGCDHLFLKLKRVVIDTCVNNHVIIDVCSENCQSLKELELSHLLILEGRFSLRCHYKTLESFSIKSCHSIYEFIREFLVKNPQLTKLKILNCNYVTDEVFQHVADNLPNLEEFSVRFQDFQTTIGENVMHLLRSTNLKKLEMNCDGAGINPFLNGLAARNQIETLHLSTFELINASAHPLCNLKTLKVLKFSCTVTSNVNVSKELCRKLASELPTLSELHIIVCSNITLNEVIEFAEYSTTLQKIVFIRHNKYPSLTKNLFSSWVEARKRNSNKEVLTMYLDYDDHHDVYELLSLEGNVAEPMNIIKILPLEGEEDDYIKW